MQLLKRLWEDEAGFVLSAEAVLLGTVGVIGATVGLTAASRAINDELVEMAYAFRSLDQSYSFKGTASCGAWTAGSCYVQPPVEESIADLCAVVDHETERAAKLRHQWEKQLEHHPKLAPERKDEEEKKRKAPPKKRRKDRDAETAA